MKTTTTIRTIAVVLLLSPACTFAREGLVPSSFFGDLPFVPEAFADVIISNEGSSIKSHSSATADTGGNSVGSGGVVQTGSASASASSQTTVTGSGGEVEIVVETEVNGEKAREEIKKTLAPGESLDVEVATSTRLRGNAEAGVETNSRRNVEEDVKDVADSVQETGRTLAESLMEVVDESVEESQEDFVTRVLTRVTNLVGSFWSAFKFW